MIKHTLRILLPILFLSAVPLSAQHVHIPDPNLRAAISEALGGAPITQASMRHLTEMDAPRANITDLTGLEHAPQLRYLRIVYNQITDLSPLAGLRLEELWLWDNQVSDLSPLAEMATLTHLDLGYNRISDLSPLSNLTNLEWLELQGNSITDVTPLANLTRLNLLTIENNLIVDHSPLDTLSLEHFTYDQICDLAPLPLQPRLENRSFPSLFTPWGFVPSNQPYLSDAERMAQHDLYFCCVGMFDGLHHRNTKDGWQVRGKIDSAIRHRDDYITLNPNIIFLTTTNAVWDSLDEWPEDSPYWLRDDKGRIEVPYDRTGLLNLNHPDVQQLVIDRVAAIAKCGLYDGVHFDAWMEHNQSLVPGMVAILKGIRERVRDDFLILANTNRWKIPASAPYINGSFFESGLPIDDSIHGEKGISRGFTHMEETLSWAESNYRLPQINAFLGFGFGSEPMDSPTNRRYMRAISTLNLTFSDGYFMYYLPGPDGGVDTGMFSGFYRYDFWDVDLGRPVGEKSTLYDVDIQGLYIREFTNGWAAYNHSGAAQVVTLPEQVHGVSSGLLNTKHALPNLDGEIYLRLKPEMPGDVNEDGIVNVLDLTLVAQAFGTDSRAADVNRDGVINILDLVFIANQL